ncbi:Ubp5-interacting protein [Exophiala dermatitidis]|uniref:High-temperature-induced dauer-formation protein n=1 Tax=Exophiala dermatitidis (strain ATCC 34100 / CBS 525.76 / NIH/UT8656) TaxID=858893 RepID=H6BW80_EXODN|nr:uncharacterized protein HMPREF1120_03330 [Exophiala dermatitidis NIH/UT8656]EHY55180.1 hypothetical protein HMPREF1120_03330 [Exophiala dermatitidis NIH/UT8656]
MGASESKLVFKQGIFRLSEERNIPASDPYWTGFWELPESVEDVFSLFTHADIRRTRDAALENLETLILAVTSRLNVLKNHPSFPDPDLAPERDALNCIRILTRLLPYVYEAEHLADWEENFFWGMRRRRTRRAPVAGEVLFDEQQEEDEANKKDQEQDFEEAKPLAEELIDTLTDLLFYAGFTIPHLPQAKSKVTYAIWQSGIGSRTSIPTNKELENNRCEVLRLLLTLTSKAMYMPSAVLPARGVRSITYMATNPDKQVVLSVLCSLINTTIKSNVSSWRLPYDHVVRRDSKQTLVVYSLQLLLVLLLYPIPEDGNGPAHKNYYRHYLGRLHRPEDFQFLADGMTQVLSQPMQATTSYLPGSQKSVKWAPEMIMLYWEALQCNKRFRAFIIESNRAHDFVILMLFYAIEYKTDVSKQGIVRMCVFVLQTMSVESSFGNNLNKRFEAQETLPPSIRIPNFKGTYADFLIISIHTLITGSKGKLEAVYPALLAIINNMAAYVQNLSVGASTRLVQLLTSMASPSFLLANESNHLLLQALLESINAMIEHQYVSNANLVYAVWRARKRILALREFTLEGGHAEIERASRRRKENALNDVSNGLSRSSTMDTVASPTRGVPPSPTPDTSMDGTFAIGDSDDSDHDDEEAPTASHSHSAHAAPRTSRPPSIASSSVADESVPIQLHGMSEKARGKMPAGAPTFSRQNSTISLGGTSTHSVGRGAFTPTPEWLESWLPELPLHTLLTVIKVLSSHPLASASERSAARNSHHGQPSDDNNSNHSPSNPSSRRSSLALDDRDPVGGISDFRTQIPATAKQPAISAILSSPSPIRVHLFEWSPLSLGWYMSVLWSLIFTAEMNIAPTSSTAATLTGAGGTVARVGVWNGTHVKLFQVATEGKREGPSLSQPKGAVDAVGSRLVQGVQGLNLGGLVSRVGGAATGRSASFQGQDNGHGHGHGHGHNLNSGTGPAPGSVREV